MAGIVAAALPWAVIVFVPGLDPSLLVMLLMGCAFAAGAAMLCFPLAKESVPARLAGTVGGIANMGMMLGGMLTQPTIGFILDRNWSGAMVNGARVYGFERIPANPPSAPAAMRAEPESRRSLHALRALVAARDFQEVVNFTFVDPAWEAELAANSNPVRLLNPIASQQSAMRSSLIGGLVETIRYNMARKQSRVRVFEVGRAFLRDSSVGDGELTVAGLAQPMRIAGAACGQAEDEQWGVIARAVDFFDIKADVEALLWPRVARFEASLHPALHPGRSARVVADAVPVGWVGELHPQWQAKFELAQPVVVFELDAEALQRVSVPHPEEPSRFPPVIRDIAVLVDAGLEVQALLDALLAEKPAIVRSVSLFDLYQGKSLPAGRKSLAFRIVMQDTEKTLTDAEADSAIAQMVGLLGERFGGTLRT
jgi:phenylalanyl-tRNA synthetase beta chain